MATIAEKSRTKEIIDRLQGMIHNASPVPLASGKVMVYKDEMQSLLAELASQMEMELKTYHEVNDRKGKIINEAKKEAEKIIYQAEHTASRMRVSKRTTNVAPIDYSMLTEEERSALGNANEIYGASLIYTDEMLTEVTNLISDAYHNIRSDYEIILQVLEEKLNTITNNRAELMEGLQEMETEDRSQQILEIGQLLSNELFNARMKNKMNPDEYGDGSVQLSLELQEEREEKARQAEEKAQRAAQALAEMTAERDALMVTVEKMKHEGMGLTVRNAKTAGVAAASRAMEEKTDSKTEKKEPSFVKMTDEKQPEIERPVSAPFVKPDSAAVMEDKEEYEIVYVTEDELEEGEEYEIEYVDEDELEEEKEYEIEYADEDESEDIPAPKPQEVLKDKVEDKEESAVEKDKEEPAIAANSKEEKLEGGRPQKDTVVGVGAVEDKSERKDDKEVKEAIKELESLDEETQKIPLIPHFKKSEKVASVPSEKIAKMATAITTDEKYNGLISRAVTQREKEEAAVAVEESDTVRMQKLEKEHGIEADVQKSDKDVKTDANGKEYVQATMRFDEDFEIMEF